MLNNFVDEMKEDDIFLFSNSLVHSRYGENGHAFITEKVENERTPFFSCGKSIMEAYWGCSDAKFTADAVFAVAKLSCDFIDKAVSLKKTFSISLILMKMLCAIKLSSSKHIDQRLTAESLLSVLENDDRKHKRMQDVIRTYRRYNEMLFAFDDREYIKPVNRDTTRN
ncbi:hypothetical protein OIY81_1328 [Cryptosporidium canis]|uniref:Uncharacterized protein n=1 Tax=Cryptosporidium canis TaxID=195482 RepID=A0ABQ8P2G6_9CRYT|nr:hypothetical protein OJ252_3391 [Cryptosporidium canis]KAJ1612295.1 hypothetical protein OIY81_1328 [Cryptosporidium canis]